MQKYFLPVHKAERHKHDHLSLPHSSTVVCDIKARSVLSINRIVCLDRNMRTLVPKTCISGRGMQLYPMLLIPA